MKYSIAVLDRFYILVFGLTLLTCNPVFATNHWYFKNNFSAQQQQKLKSWISETKSGLEQLVAPLPFNTHFVFYKRHLQREPVPWANTQRDQVQGVHFYVDTRYQLDRFQKDWTASHEISHLLIPWLGDEYRWFAEGLASYLQYPVMYTNKQLTWRQAYERYRDNLQVAAKHTATRKQSIAQVSKRMHAARAYKVVYWGGALYFMKVDRQLQLVKNRRVFDVLGEYQRCCRLNARWGKSGFEPLLKHLDRISQTTLFSDTLYEFTQQVGFPDFADELEWIKDRPPTSRQHDHLSLD